jgi:hypothetical protein
MAAPDFTAGRPPTAAELQFLVPLFVRKTSNQSVTSSTTLVNDSALVLPMLASVTYELTAQLFYIGNDTGDIKVTFTQPTGSTLSWGPIGASQAAVTGSATAGTGEWWGTNVNTTASPTTSMPMGGSTSDLHMVIRGIVVVSATAGNLQLQWAQNTSNGTATTVKAGSWMSLRRVA